ncbi:hypothetical protein VTN96DRAFT_8013 [Rasamsonia emersonii]|uniref:Uncharacterized protein n=1 Tax=Rasamsonia emersonii (strain ATCC 16479 / CBS 393.64 / IMI 116815) TaxID=1408163 RepID=A0A0F4YL84_RASE3|nr:hypothetical protein T310_7701 [Rasamsonia emersonii CBS 393.64]KKA18353.1 hypothetical protein T310_7701 [Rasamsonia emersonii CBS 393.64]
MALSLELILAIFTLMVTIFGVMSQLFGNFRAGRLQKSMDEGLKSLKDCVTLLKELIKHLERLEMPIYTRSSSQSSSRVVYNPSADFSASSSSDSSFYNPSAACLV